MTWQEMHQKFARLFWALHSAWALISGIAVLVLAHNRYGFLRWVVLFIALTWGSTLLFSRLVAGESRVLRFAQGLVSYLTRVMYQETLFFLIPFYFYSATFPSWNFLYVIALAAFAVLSCFDMLFDRLLREHRWFSTGFFAFVSFSALQFFLPLLLRTRIDNSEYIAAGISFLAALALAKRFHDLRDGRQVGAIAIAFAATLLAIFVFRPLLPPVPLRMTSLRVSGALNLHTLKAPHDYETEIPAAELKNGRLFVVATIFSPERIPARIQVRFLQHGTLLRASRVSSLTAHRGGFRVWDSLHLPANHSSGTYRIEIWSSGQLLGKRDIRIIGGGVRTTAADARTFGPAC